jgi:hypothetical protein
MQNFHQSMWDHEILYADRSSDDEQLIIDHFCGGKKAGRWNLKFIFYFMEITHEPLHLHKVRYMKDSKHTYKFYFNNYFL